MTNYHVLIASGGFYTHERAARATYRQYSSSDMTEAARLLAGGQLSKDEIMAMYGDGLPESTLRAHAQIYAAGGTPRRPGRPPTLAERDEEWLAAWVKLLFRLGVPVTKARLLLKAREIAALRGVSFFGPNGLPGRSWWDAFRRRHGLKLATASFMTRSAAQTLTPEALDGFYTLLFGVLDEYDVPKELIWGCDETGVNRAVGTKAFVVVPEGSRRVKHVGSEWPEHVTLLGCVSSIGDRLPPFVLRKGKGMRFTENPLEGADPTACLVFTRKPAVSCKHRHELLAMFAMLMPLVVCSQGMEQHRQLHAVHNVVRVANRQPLQGFAACGTLGCAAGGLAYVQAQP